MSNTTTETRFMPAMATARNARTALTPEDLNIAGRARDIWRTLREDAGLMAVLTSVPGVKWMVYRLHREDDRSDFLEALGKAIVQLSSLGVPEAFFRRIHLFIGEIIDECFAGKSRRSRAELDQLEFDAEQRENALQHKRLIRGSATPDDLEAEASAIRAEVSVEIERARLLEKEARLMRAGFALAGTSA